jgi:putative membrane-bound dehydrogenase-like protein
MPFLRIPRLFFFVFFVSFVVNEPARAALRAGAYAQDITPTQFPVIVNGGFTEVIATKANDALHARAIVLEDGKERIAIVVVDSCMLPRELLDDAKSRANKLTGIAVDRMLISATHTHSAPSSMGCLGSDADANYVKILPDLLARAIDEANKRLAPAKIGWTVVNDAEHTACRRWIFRPDRMRNDPLGELTVRANMHPGYLSPDAIGPTGPIDPGLSIVSIQHSDGRPLALLANYSMHYVGTQPLSADYYGRFCDKIAKLLNAGADFVGVMSQGTSGDMWLADYSKPAPATRPTIDTYSDAIAREVAEACKSIQYTGEAPIAMRETMLKLKRRVPDEKRLAWAKEKVAALGNSKPKLQPDIYAREAIFLHDDPERELKLQAIRIGDLAIAAIPNEVFALTGLKIKGMSPLAMTFTMELANGSEGYIPPPEQHKLGGYTTWPARTAALEVEAEPKIAGAVLKLLEDVCRKPRRSIAFPDDDYSQAVWNSGASAYYAMRDFAGRASFNYVKNPTLGYYEDGVVFYLPGPESIPSARAAHFAGGRMVASAGDELGASYSVELLAWNRLSPDARAVTAYLFSRGADGDKDAAGDHLGIGGAYDDGVAKGKLIFFNGNRSNRLLVGNSELPPRTWHHVAMVRDGNKVAVYLDGKLEISGEADVTIGKTQSLFFGGRCDNFANLEGKMCGAAVYSRALMAKEIGAHFKATGLTQDSGLSTQDSKFKRASNPRSPEETLKSIHLSPDLAIELVAAEPLIADPVAIDWGPDGKLWVVEMADYPYGMDGKGKPGGRIKYLESTKNDGHYDKATLFLDNIRMPTGIIAWRKGVIVTAAPEIFYAEDTDGDGKADKREVLFKGFKEGNPQLRVNGLRWGLDNWLYVGNGWSGGAVESLKTGRKLDIKGHDLRLNPDTGEMELVSGVSQFGREHDDFGRWFGTDNAHPLFQYVLDDHYLRQNAQLNLGDGKNQLLPLPLPPVFPKSPFAKRYIGLDHHGHFTSACGISVYRDNLLFTQDSQELNAFICEPVHNLVQRQVLTESGATFSARRVDGEKEADFVAGEDPWFRPVMTRCGPDGAIWIVDFYRYMIEHPDWLNDLGKTELAPFYRDGDDRGRIYRIYPKNKRPRAIPRLDGLSTQQLVASLESPSGFVRDLAQRMLVWKNDPAAAAPLADLFNNSKNAMARLHALCTLAGIRDPKSEISNLKSEILQTALSDPHPAVRANAVRLADGRTEPVLVESMISLAKDPNPLVGLQLAYTLGHVPGDQAAAALARIAARDPDDRWIAAAVASAAPEHRRNLTAAVLADPRQLGTPLYDHLLAMAVALNDADAIGQFMDRVNGTSEPQMKGLARLLDALSAAKRPIDSSAGVDDRLRPTIDTASRFAVDPKLPFTTRLAAADLLGRLANRRKDDLAIAAGLLAPQSPADLQTAAVRATARTLDPSVPAVLLKDWPSHGPALRLTIGDALLAREAWALELAQSPAARDLDFARRQRLLNHPSAKIKEAAKQTLAQTAVNADRQKVIDAYQRVLALTGDAAHGKELFAQHCATCHRIGTAPVGHDLGPNLLTVRDWTKENLITAVLDPDRTVEPRYIAYTATLNDGTVLTGLLTSESAGNVILKTLDDAEHPLPRHNLKSLVSTNHSLMPQGFEAAIGVEELADLLAYVQSPAAK